MFEVINNSENHGIGEDETKKQAQAIAERFRKFRGAWSHYQVE
jgi:hypothetical protein